MTTLRAGLRLLAAADAALAAVVFGLGWSLIALALAVLAIDTALLSVAPDRWLRAAARPLAALGIASARAAIRG